MTPGDVFGSPQYRFQKTPAAIKRPVVSFTPGSFPSLLSRDLVTFSHNSLQFAGRDRHLKDKRDSNNKTIQGEASLLAEKEADVLEFKNKLGLVQRGQENGETLGAAVGLTAGPTAGMVAGATASSAVGFMDLGAMTVLGTLVGTIGGPTAVAKITGPINKAMTRFSKGLETEESYQKKLKAIEPDYDILKARVDEGNTVLSALRRMKPKAKTAVHVLNVDGKDVFKDTEYQALDKAHRTDYEEVDDELLVVKPMVIRIPGFRERFEKITGKPLRDKGVPLLLQDLYTDEDDDGVKQVLALKRLYGVEGDPAIESRARYPEFLRHANPTVAATALQMMTQHEAIRQPEVFNQALVDFLESKEPTRVKAALECITQAEPKDQAIDTALRQLANPKASQLPQEIKNLALSLWNDRRSKGIAPVYDSHQASRNILSGMVGNEALEDRLETLLGNYFHTLESGGLPSPALKIYIPGEHGIGKTSLIHKMQEVLYPNSAGVIHIKPSNITDEKGLIDLIKEACPESAFGKKFLQDRIIFIDEFQEVDNIKSEQAKQQFLVDMKKLFSVDEADKKEMQALFKQHNLDIGNTILAIASNKDLTAHKQKDIEKDKIIKAMQTTEGEGLLNRLSAITRPRSTNYVKLNPDLRNYIDQFVHHFGRRQYYKNIDNRKFDGLVTLTDAAKQAFIQNLTEDNSTTSDNVSGRSLADCMVEDINQAITQAERKGTKFVEKGGKITEPIKVDVNSSGSFIVSSALS